ncbi:hypothetical protein [Haliangium sp.]|uniref:hypothetical protein n=1 Tax=Haliangium sp. TaxID=2663208 RepID=UPI003D105652
MSVKEAPLAKVKRLHGSKEALIDSLAAALAKHSDDGQDEIKARLAGAPNTKLLRLHEALAAVGDKYDGSKDKLVEIVSAARGHAKDADYVAKLKTFSIPKLLDMTRAG